MGRRQGTPQRHSGAKRASGNGQSPDSSSKMDERKPKRPRMEDRAWDSAAKKREHRSQHQPPSFSPSPAMPIQPDSKKSPEKRSYIWSPPQRASQDGCASWGPGPYLPAPQSASTVAGSHSEGHPPLELQDLALQPGMLTSEHPAAGVAPATAEKPCHAAQWAQQQHRQPQQDDSDDWGPWTASGYAAGMDRRDPPPPPQRQHQSLLPSQRCPPPPQPPAAARKLALPCPVTPQPAPTTPRASSSLQQSPPCRRVPQPPPMLPPRQPGTPRARAQPSTPRFCEASDKEERSKWQRRPQPPQPPAAPATPPVLHRQPSTPEVLPLAVQSPKMKPTVASPRRTDAPPRSHSPPPGHFGSPPRNSMARPDSPVTFRASPSPLPPRVGRIPMTPEAMKKGSPRGVGSPKTAKSPGGSQNTSKAWAQKSKKFLAKLAKMEKEKRDSKLRHFRKRIDQKPSSVLSKFPGMSVDEVKLLIEEACKHFGGGKQHQQTDADAGACGAATPQQADDAQVQGGDQQVVHAAPLEVSDSLPTGESNPQPRLTAQGRGTAQSPQERPAPKTPRRNAAAKQGCRIFIGGLPHDVSAGELKEHFKSHGLVTDAVSMGTRGRGFGFVEFSHPSSAEAALAAAPHLLHGCHVHVKMAWARPDSNGEAGVLDKPCTGTGSFPEPAGALSLHNPAAAQPIMQHLVRAGAVSWQNVMCFRPPDEDLPAVPPALPPPHLSSLPPAPPAPPMARCEGRFVSPRASSRPRPPAMPPSTPRRGATEGRMLTESACEIPAKGFVQPHTPQRMAQPMSKDEDWKTPQTEWSWRDHMQHQRWTGNESYHAGRWQSWDAWLDHNLGQSW